MTERLMQALQGGLVRAWARRGILACMLWPLSICYGALFAVRRMLFQRGWFSTRRVDAVVVVVGNVMAGGTGKTPTVMALVKHLHLQNHVIGIISRGYGRSSVDCLEVFPDSSPRQVGDEPLLLRRATNSPVFVAQSRHTAALALLARYPQTEVIICDDGLQHYALYRDIEVCIFDDRGCANGWLLPAGPLRERWPRKALANVGQRDDRLLVLHTGTRPAFSGYTAQRRLARVAIRSDGSGVPIESLRTPGTRPLLALAGIGQPETFFSMLDALQLPVQRTIALSDHYSFDSYSRSIYAHYTIICTEKDAIKLWPVEPTALAIAMEMIVEPGFLVKLDTLLSELLEGKLSSRHGYKIT
jgi:tetraacyldisaccharide 4'-kinase